MEKLVSIIIPVYNVEKYLNYCIRSVVNQTYKNIEIILVDDGSPDKCPEICEEWKMNDERIKVIHQENQGLSGARNTGIQNANGEYIIFVDSDDVISDVFVATLLELLNEYNSDMVICDNLRINNYDEFASYNEENNLKIEIFNGIDACERIYNGYPGFVTATSKIYKKELIKEILFPIGRIHEDNFTSYKHFLKCEKIVYINKKLYGYLIRENSITKSKFTEKNFDRYDAFLEEANYYKNASLNKALISLLKQFMYVLSTDYTRTNDKKLKAKMRTIQKKATLFIKENRKLFNKEDLDWLLAPHLNNKLKDIYWKKIVLRNKIKNILIK